MQAIEEEYHHLWQLDSEKQQANPGEGKSIYGDTLRACDRLFSERLSHQDLRDLAASSDSLPIRIQDSKHGFYQRLLQHMVHFFVEIGDREALVDVLSKRYPSNQGSNLRLEYYLASRTSLLQDFRGNRLKDPMLVLGEAYSRCRTLEVREEIVAAVRRSFVGQGIGGKDDAEFVAHAMQWYEKEKGHLIVNDYYNRNDNWPLEDTELVFNLSPSEVSGGRQPLFLKTTSEQSGSGGIGAVFMFWLIHAGIAAVLCAPMVILGRKRVRWRPWEVLAFMLPFWVWLLLMASPLSIGRKGLGNLAEPFYLSLAVPIAAMVRVGIGRRLDERAHVSLLIAALVGALCLGAAGIFFLVPPRVIG